VLRRSWLYLSGVVLMLGPARTGAAGRPTFCSSWPTITPITQLSCYGSLINETFQLDRIADGGMRFDRAFMRTSGCVPSRATLLDRYATRPGPKLAKGQFTWLTKMGRYDLGLDRPEHLGKDGLRYWTYQTYLQGVPAADRLHR
jgi:hypothetical protein